MIAKLSKLNSAQTLLCKFKGMWPSAKVLVWFMSHGCQNSPILNMSVLIHLNLLTQAFFQSALSTLIHHQDSGSCPENSCQPLCQNRFWKKDAKKNDAIQVVNPADIWHGLLTVVQLSHYPQCTRGLEAQLRCCNDRARRLKLKVRRRKVQTTGSKNKQQTCGVFGPKPAWWRILALSCKVQVNNLTGVKLHKMQNRDSSV